MSTGRGEPEKKEELQTQNGYRRSLNPTGGKSEDAAGVVREKLPWWLRGGRASCKALAGPCLWRGSLQPFIAVLFIY